MDAKLVYLVCETFVERCQRRVAATPYQAGAFERAAHTELELLRQELSKLEPEDKPVVTV